MADIKEIYAAMSASVDNGYKALVECLKEHGRFVNMSEKGGDAVYAIDYISDEAVERKVLAVRLDEGDDVEIYLCPLQKLFTVEDGAWDIFKDDDWESFWKGETKGYWISLRHSEVYFIHTLFNILESIGWYISEKK